MAKVIATNTVHRKHPTREGEQEVIAPKVEFESSGEELESLLRLKAVKLKDTPKEEAPKKAVTKTAAKSGTKTAAKADTKPPAGDETGDLGDL